MILSRLNELLRDGATAHAPSAPWDARRTSALRALVGGAAEAVLEGGLGDVLLGQGLVCEVGDGRDVARAVNTFNFAWGLTVVPARVSPSRWLVWNVDNLWRGLGGGADAADLLSALEALASGAPQAGWYRGLRRGEALCSRRPVAAPAASWPGRAVITIPAFNAPDRLAALLDGLLENAAVFGWTGVPIVVFDASSEEFRAANRRLVRERSTGRADIAYLGAEHARPPALADLSAFAASHARAGLPGAELFNASAGGNLNCCFSYFGPDVTVLSFDHDTVPSVDVPVQALDSLDCSTVELDGGVHLVEVASAAQPTRRIPVDVLSASRPRDPGEAFVLAGREVVLGDNESYSALALDEAATRPAEYAATHIAGMQDHSARFLIESALEAGDSLLRVTPRRFVPAKPTLPISAARSKLATTTLTVRRAGLPGESVGFVGTHVRVHDLLTGRLQWLLHRRPVYWAPVYVTHDREYGLRQERRYGDYLLNEEYMRAILEVVSAVEHAGPAPSWPELAARWDGALRGWAAEATIDAFVDRARDLVRRLHEARVDPSYEHAAESIAAAFRLDASPSSARAHHRTEISREAARVSAHLRSRPWVNAKGRVAGGAYYRALTRSPRRADLLGRAEAP